MTIKTSLHEPSAAQLAFRAELITLLRKYGEKLTPEEVLAFCSYTVGQVLALQDQRTMTQDMAIKLIKANIELGNQHAVAEMMKTQGQA